MVRRHMPRTNKSPKVNVDFTDYFKKAHGRFVDFLDKAKSQSAIHVVSTENDRNKRHKPPLIRVEGLVDAFKLVAWQMQMLACFRFLQWCIKYFLCGPGSRNQGHRRPPGSQQLLLRLTLRPRPKSGGLGRTCGRRPVPKRTQFKFRGEPSWSPTQVRC